MPSKDKFCIISSDEAERLFTEHTVLKVTGGPRVVMFLDHQNFNELVIEFLRSSNSKRNKLYFQLEEYFDIIIDQVLKEHVRWNIKPSSNELFEYRQDCKSQLFMAFQTIKMNKRMYRYFEQSAIYFFWAANRKLLKEGKRLVYQSVDTFETEPIQHTQVYNAEVGKLIKQNAARLLSSPLLITSYKRNHVKVLKTLISWLNDPIECDFSHKKEMLANLRDITGLSTKQIRRSLKKLKPLLFKPLN